MLRHEFVVFVLISVVGGVQKSSRYPLKGFYCKDPDTGKLHPVNSTWTSSTFCGSYTCRIKKKSNDGNQVSLELSINNTETDIENNSKVGKRKHEDTVSKEGLGNWTTLIEKLKTTSNRTKQVDLFANDVSYKDEEVSAENVEGDRLLTEKEVKALTILLKTIKLSELDAILQVFHLAHDLYAEVDKVIEGAESSEQKISDATRLKGEEEDKKGHIVSYWYEPLTIMNSKVKADAKNFMNKANNKNKNSVASQMSTTETKKGSVSVKLNPVKLENKDVITKTMTTDNVKQASNYHHPLPDLLRKPSFTRTPQRTSNSYSKASAILPQIAKLNDRPVIPLSKAAFPVSYEAPFTSQEHKKKPDKCSKNGEVTLLSKKLNVLPWFATKGDTSYNLKRAELVQIPRRNGAQSLGIPLEYIAAIAKGANPLSFLTIAKSGKNIKHVPVVTAEVARHPGNIILDEEINAAGGAHTDPGPLLDPVRNSVENVMPGWSAGLLGVPVFNDMKSPEETIYSGNLLPFPFKKNAKIRRLPYLAENKRQKRDNEFNGDDYEVYLEKSTCATDIEPGFFRMGDPTKPYPECCPQRIQRNVQKNLHT